MDDDALLAAVDARLAEASPDDARAATALRAVLGALGEALPPGLLVDLREALPRRAGDLLPTRADAPGGDSLPLESMTALENRVLSAATSVGTDDLDALARTAGVELDDARWALGHLRESGALPS